MEIFKCIHKDCLFEPTTCRTCYLIHMQTTARYIDLTGKHKLHRRFAFHQNHLLMEHNNDCINKDLKHPIWQDKKN